LSIQKKLANAYLWNVVGRWGIRLIGIASTLILVRLIEPTAFGLVALATICIGFFDTFTDLGINRYLISQTEIDNKALNTSWTLAILIRSFVTATLILSSGFLAEFVGAPEVQTIIMVVSIGGLLGSFNNIGLVQYEKNLDYKKLTLLIIVTKVFATMLTLFIAFIYPNHWALIAGGLLSAVIYLFGSYFICEYRPKFDFRFNKKQFSFSLKIMLRAIIGYSRNKLDTLLVGKLFNASMVGKYSIGLEFAVLPLAEVITPASRAMFPALAQYKNQKEELFDKTYKYFALVYMFVLPCIVGIWFVAPQFCPVILGEKWAETSPIMASLAILMLPFPLTAITNNLFDYLGKTGLSIFGDVVGISLLLACFWLIPFENVEQFSITRGLVGLAAFFAVLLFARFTIGLSLFKMFTVLAIPALSAACMYCFFSFIYVNTEVSLVGLLINMIIGALVYCISLFCIMYVAKDKVIVWKFWYERLSSLISQGITHYKRVKL
jgi:O-antigen/teichoic acid export membrane protein